MTGSIYPASVDFNFDFDLMLAFYRREEWLSALQVFANVSEDERAVTERVKEVFREIALPADGA